MIPQRTMTFFALCTRCDLLWFEVRRKIKLIKIHFLCWILFLRAAALSDPGYSTSNIYARHCDFTWTSCPFSTKMCSEAHGRSPICFNVICFFCGIVRRYLREKIATCSPSLISWQLCQPLKLGLRSQRTLRHNGTSKRKQFLGWQWKVWKPDL